MIRHNRDWSDLSYTIKLLFILQMLPVLVKLNVKLRSIKVVTSSYDCEYPNNITVFCFCIAITILLSEIDGVDVFKAR